MSKKGVFYFEFSNNFEVEDDEEITCVYYGFNMNMLDDRLEEEMDMDWEEFCCDMEEEYGTHDWSSAPHDEVAGIGYSAYECEFARIPELMEKWRAYLESRPDTADVTAVVKLDVTMDDVMKMSDLDLYNQIARQLK